MNAKLPSSEVTLEVLNPRGVLQSMPISGLTNPRVKDLAGKRIAFMSEKEESLHFFDALEVLLKQKYPTCTIFRCDSPANPMRPDNTAEVAAKCDVWLQGVKTSGSSVYDYDIKMEKLGRPGAPYCIDSLLMQRKRLAEVNGMPTLRIITIPSIDYLGAEGNREKMKMVAASVMEKTIKTLTIPLTEEEKHPKPFTYDYSPMKFTGRSYEEAYEKFQQYFMDIQAGDGLPLTPPTREAVDWMLTGTSRSSQEKLGVMSPRPGMATVEKIAINAVMAGARPEYLPVIIAGIECLTEKGFNLYHLSTSTGCPTPIIWVNGPIAEEIHMNSGLGFLGRGNRANNTIGRAIGLCCINIGWRLMDADAGFLGDPEGFCNYTFAENEKESPWDSFAIDCGFKPTDSTITINETMYYDRLGPGGGMRSDPPEKSLETMVNKLGGGNRGGVIQHMMFAKMMRYQIAMHPTFARQLAEMGFTKYSLQRYFYEKTCLNWDDLTPEEQVMIKDATRKNLASGLKPEDCKSGLKFPIVEKPEYIAILVAGDAAGSTVTWGSPVGSTTLSPDMTGHEHKTPVAFMTKVIRGATLTKAGH